ISKRDWSSDVCSSDLLSSASWAGLVNNLNFGLSWGVFPLLFASASLSDGRIGLLFAIYPGVWGLGQLATGALSDRVGRKHLVVWGMTIQGVALGVRSEERRVGEGERRW